MKSCAFFGHREIWENIDDSLTNILVDLIEKEGVSKFYVGNQGAFDKIVVDKLRILKKQYPHIEYYIVLAYLPSKEDLYGYEPEETIYPEGLEKTLPRYSIIKRNQWMIEMSDIVVTYVCHPLGGALRAKEYAQRKGRKIINIAE